MSNQTIDRLVGRATALLETAGKEAPQGTFEGLFVMIRTADGELRGGIGTTEAPRSQPSSTLVQELVATAAADPRHPPIEGHEVDGLRLELWVLPDPPRRIREPHELDPENDVLRVRQGLYAGTFLPDVAREKGWDAEASLAYATRKAGLPAAKWRDPQTEVLAYRAIRLSEAVE